MRHQILNACCPQETKTDIRIRGGNKGRRLERLFIHDGLGACSEGAFLAENKFEEISEEVL